MMMMMSTTMKIIIITTVMMTAMTKYRQADIIHTKTMPSDTCTN